MLGKKSWKVNKNSFWRPSHKGILSANIPFLGPPPPSSPHIKFLAPHPMDQSQNHYSREPDFKHVVASAFSVLDQPPPPTLREILGAYRAKGDGDRDMLLAMLNAKAAEDQRLASVAALHRSVLEAYQNTSSPDQHPLPRLNGSHHYPTPSFTQSPPRHDHQRPNRRSHHRAPSGSRSPRTRTYLPSMREVPAPYSEHPRKRHRTSHSPSHHMGIYEAHSGSQPEHLPPSPYSSSERSDSAEYSPRSRASMAIGSLLSAGPRKEPNGDES